MGGMRNVAPTGAEGARSVTGPVHDVLGALVARYAQADASAARPTVTQAPYTPGRPGPFRVDLQHTAPDRARNRTWLSDVAHQMAGHPGVAAAVAIPPAVYVRPDYEWLREHVVP
ncbi:MAG: hypothetical protein QOI20_454, partial [Acidimicrobiaceae bacterium]|nr:hypothetical protein [Acidimicrobiaceae bacterium]